MRSSARVAPLFALLLAVGCTDSPETCVPGASSACAGAGGCAGAQVCNAEGSAFGPCDCGAQADAGTGAGADGGADAGADAGCSLVNNTGCPQGERCGWLLTTGSAGAAGCAPAGTVPLFGACTYDSVAKHDNCQAGLGCVNGTCHAFCTASPDSCAENFACVRYSNFDDGSGNVGVCEATCDPVTQVRDSDGAPACGTPDGGSPLYGCYGGPTQGFFCVPTNATGATRTHRMDAAGPSPGQAYVNGCAPGFIPLLSRSSTDETVVCIATCRPSESYSGQMSLVRGAPPHTCPARGATAASEECRYLHWVEPEGWPLTPYSNTVGFCFDHTQYTWDDDNNPQTPAVQHPSCGSFTSPSHLGWGCGPRQ